MTLPYWKGCNFNFYTISEFSVIRTTVAVVALKFLCLIIRWVHLFIIHPVKRYEGLDFMQSRLSRYSCGCKSFVTHLAKLLIYKKDSSLPRIRQSCQVLVLDIPGVLGNMLLPYWKDCNLNFYTISEFSVIRTTVAVVALKFSCLVKRWVHLSIIHPVKHYEGLEFVPNRPSRYSCVCKPFVTHLVKRLIYEKRYFITKD